MAAVSVGEINAKLTADTKGYTTGLNKAGAQTATFSKQVGGNAAQMASFSQQLAATGAMLTNLSKSSAAMSGAAVSGASAMAVSQGQLNATTTATTALADESQTLAESLKPVEQNAQAVGRVAAEATKGGMTSMMAMAADLAVVLTATGFAAQYMAAKIATITGITATVSGKIPGLSKAITAVGLTSRVASRSLSGASASMAAAGTVAGAAGAEVAKSASRTALAFGVMGQAGGGLLKVLGKLGGPVAAALVIGAPMALKSAKATSEMNEQLNAMKVQFEGAEGAAVAWATRTAQGYQLTSMQAASAAAQFGAFFDAAGTSAKTSLALSSSLVELSTDIASFRNLALDEAIQKTTAALAGEYEPMRRIGILLNESTVASKAYEEGWADVGAELTEGQKVLARTALIIEQTDKIQGDAARTAFGYANQTRQLQANSGRLAEEVGKLGLPFITFGKIIANIVVFSLAEFARTISTVVGAIFGLVASVGKIPGVAQVFGFLGKSIAALSGANADSKKTTNDLAAALAAVRVEAVSSKAAIEAFRKALDEGNYAQAEAKLQTIESINARQEQLVVEAAAAKETDKGKSSILDYVKATLRMNSTMYTTTALTKDQRNVMGATISVTKEQAQEFDKLEGEYREAIKALETKIRLDERQNEIIQQTTFKIHALEYATKALKELQDQAAADMSDVISAYDSLSSAKERATEATSSLHKLEKERAEFVKKGAVDQDKVTAATDRYKSAQEKVTDTLARRVEIEKELAKLTAPATQKEITAAVLDHEQAVRDLRSAELDLLDALDQQAAAHQSVIDIGNEIIKTDKEIAKNAQVVADAIAGVAGQLTGFAKDLQSSIESVLDPTKEWNKEVEKTTDNLDKVIDAQNSYAKAAEIFGINSAAATHALNSLNRAQADAKKKNDDNSNSLAKLRANLQKNIQFMKDWKNNLTKISEKAGPEIAQAFANLGPEWAGAIGEAANMSAEQLKSTWGPIFQEMGDAKSVKGVVKLANALGDTGIDQEWLNGKLEEGIELQDTLTGLRKDHTAAQRDAERADMAVAGAIAEVTRKTWAADEAQIALNATTNKGIIVTAEIAGLTRDLAKADQDVAAAIHDQNTAYDALLKSQAGDPEWHRKLAEFDERIAAARTAESAALKDVVTRQYEYGTALDVSNGIRRSDLEILQGKLKVLQDAGFLPDEIQKTLKIDVQTGAIGALSTKLDVPPALLAQVGISIGAKTAEELINKALPIAQAIIDNMAKAWMVSAPSGGTSFPGGRNTPFQPSQHGSIMPPTGGPFPMLLHPGEIVAPMRDILGLGAEMGGGGGGGDTYYIDLGGFIGDRRQLIDALHEGLLSKKRRSGQLGL